MKKDEGEKDKNEKKAPVDAGLLFGDLSDTGCFCECKKQFYPVTEKRAVTGKGNKTG